MNIDLKIFVLTGFVFLGTISYGQQGKHSMEEFKKDLCLSDEQVEKIEKVHNSYADEKAALRKRMEEIRAKEKAEIEKILTVGQLKKLEELKAKKKEHKK